MKELITPNDEHFYNRQWTHYNDGTFPLSNSTPDADMDTDLAWDLTQGDPNITVAILSSGLKLDHPEFADRAWINTDEVLDGTDTDNNGYIDDLNWGWDFSEGDNSPDDGYSLGTYVTGIALATGNNTIGLAGVNWNSKIMVCRIQDDNGVNYANNDIDAIYYAVDNGANTIIINFFFHNNDPLLEEAVDYAYDNNVSIVTSIANGNELIWSYPAKYENVFSVGSTDPDDTRSVPFDGWFTGSNFGPELDFVAPGNYTYIIDNTSNTNYELHFGSCFGSSAALSGVISLLLSINPDLTVPEIYAILEATSEDQVGDSEDTPGWDQYYGHGRINAHDAVAMTILGLEENTNLESNIILYPNPTTSIVNLEGNTNEIQVNIYDLLGRELLSQNATNQLDVSFLETGTYIVQLTDGIKSTTSKLIKN